MMQLSLDIKIVTNPTIHELTCMFGNGNLGNA